jgi:hypothetical protein
VHLSKFFPSTWLIDFISRDFARATDALPSRNVRRKISFALKLCKQEQAIEESEVSSCRGQIFHTLINNCVENLIVQKYFLSGSASLLPPPAPQILTATRRR